MALCRTTTNYASGWKQKCQVPTPSLCRPAVDAPWALHTYDRQEVDRERHNL
ncbi:hypothetical protein M378DRAFT_168383, partial [Amanita muscaria Koide BX008]